MVIALVVGIALNPLAARPAVQPGMNFCVKTLLRWAVALLGLRVGLGDIAALGAETAILIVIAMAATMASGFRALESAGARLQSAGRCRHGGMRRFRDARDVDCCPRIQRQEGRHCLRGRGSERARNTAMLVYPPLCILLGFDEQTTGVMLGGTIHDVAQVVGAGYAVSDAVGNKAVIVKLFACSCCCRWC
jgi:uncharacterized membrane protein YadS